jgi:hypothetical protein
MYERHSSVTPESTDAGPVRLPNTIRDRIWHTQGAAAVG